jgi:dTMP kinase
LVPDLTFFIDISLQERKKRIRNDQLDRLESEQNHFHERVREGFLKICKNNEDRFVKINGEKSVKEISNIIWENIGRKLNE